MAYTAETINARVRNLRGDAVTAARALLTHLDRAGKARDTLDTALDDLGMFASNRKAEISDAEHTFDETLVGLLDAEEFDVEALRAHLTAYHVTTAEDSADVAASVEATDEAAAQVTDETEAPRSKRRRGQAAAETAEG